MEENLLKSFKTVAHRGAFDNDAGIPENTMPAYLRAAGKGLAIELDVRLSGDGKIVCVHDGRLMRAAGRDLVVEDEDIDTLRGFGVFGTEHKIPLFEEVLAQVCVPLMVEVKTWNPKGVSFAEYLETMMEKVCDLLENYKGGFAVESFDYRVIKWLKNNRPDIARGLTVAFFLRHFSGRKSLERLDPHFFAVSLKKLSEEKYRGLKEKGLAVFSWTAATEEELARALSVSDSVIVNTKDLVVFD